MVAGHHTLIRFATSVSQKNRRPVIFANALNPAEVTGADLHVLQRIVSEDQDRKLKTAEL